jgi:hypothetical protein
MFYITLAVKWHTDRWNPSKGEEGDGTGTIVVPIETDNATAALRHLTASLTRIVRARRVEACDDDSPTIPPYLPYYRENVSNTREVELRRITDLELTRALANVIEAFDNARNRHPREPSLSSPAHRAQYELDVAHVDEARKVLAAMLPKPKVTP